MIKMVILLSYFLLSSDIVFAKNVILSSKINACFESASSQYKIPKEVLISIANVESKFNPLAVNVNKNGSYDLGVMQINSSWFSRLNQMGITEKMLKNPCQNITIGAWILAQNIQQYGFNWIAIQHYNGSDTQLKYAQKIYNSIKQYNPNLTQKMSHNTCESHSYVQPKAQSKKQLFFTN